MVDGITITPHFGGDGKDFVIERSQDCTDILEHNAMLRAQEQRSDWGRHVASVPLVVILKWMDEEWHRGNRSLRLFSKEFDALVANIL